MLKGKYKGQLRLVDVYALNWDTAKIITMKLLLVSESQKGVGVVFSDFKNGGFSCCYYCYVKLSCPLLRGQLLRAL